VVKNKKTGENGLAGIADMAGLADKQEPPCSFC